MDHATRTFLYQVLANDSALITLLGSAKIHEGVAPTGTPLPYVVFQEYTTVDVMGMGATRLWTNDLWLIRAMARTQSFLGDLKSMAERIDAVLHAASGTNVNGTVWACTRERRLQQIEQPDGGDQVRHLGGIYRILAS